MDQPAPPIYARFSLVLRPCLWPASQWRSCLQLMELPIWGLGSNKGPNLHITNGVRCSASEGSTLTRKAEIQNESSLSAPACEIPLSPIHR
jgi:hypothetical protein